MTGFYCEEDTEEQIADRVTDEELREQIRSLQARVRRGEERRRALIHIMSDLNQLNRRLSDQRKAMLHILVDYERDRSRLARQSDRLDNSRRALLHILKDSHQSNLRLERSRKAMINIMDDLRKTTEEMLRREQELRDKQEQLVQAGKMATLGELTTGIAHELNNPLNNIGLFIGNAIDLIQLRTSNTDRILNELNSAASQVRTASEIISHLRTFGRAAPVMFEPIPINEIVLRAISLIQEQLRLRQIEVVVDLWPAPLVVMANAIQLEQVFINLLSNASDAVLGADRKQIRVSSSADDGGVMLMFCDTGPGVPKGLEQRIFDPFFTTKDVGEGTGLGLSITYAIVKDHHGTIEVTQPAPGYSCAFAIELPLAEAEEREEGQ